MHLHGVIRVALRQQVCGGQSRDAQNDRQTMGEKSPERKRENRKWLPFNCDGLLRKAVAVAQRTLGRVGVSIHTRHVIWKEHSLSIRSSRSRKWFARFLANAHRSNIRRWCSLAEGPSTCTTTGQSEWQCGSTCTAMSYMSQTQRLGPSSASVHDVSSPLDLFSISTVSEVTFKWIHISLPPSRNLSLVLLKIFKSFLLLFHECSPVG